MTGMIVVSIVNLLPILFVEIIDKIHPNIPPIGNSDVIIDFSFPLNFIVLSFSYNENAGDVHPRNSPQARIPKLPNGKITPNYYIQ